MIRNVRWFQEACSRISAPRVWQDQGELGLGRGGRDYILQDLEIEGLILEQCLILKPGDLGVKPSSTPYWL